MHRLLPATLLALVAPALLAVETGVDRPGADGGQITTMTFHERIIVRVPRVGPPPRQLTWKEKRGPRCIAANELAGALVSAPGVVDLVLTGNRRVRAPARRRLRAARLLFGLLPQAVRRRAGVRRPRRHSRPIGNVVPDRHLQDAQTGDRQALIP